MIPKLTKLGRDAAVNTAMWLENRLHIATMFEHTAGHHVPKSSGSWFYVFGSMTLLCFVIQIVTGICLALVYVPSASNAYGSLEYITYEQTLGWFLRALHGWGSNFMVGIMLLHMTQVFLFGAYKYPRELTWMSGVVLMLCTFGMAFTGQVLRFDQDSYWGLGIGAAITGRIPFIGSEAVEFLLGGPIIASSTLSRFFSVHVFVLPGAILAVVSMHLRLVLVKGINEFPTPGHVVTKETYDADYEKIIEKEGVAFVPDAISKDLVANGALLILIVLCAAIFGPYGPSGVPDPTFIHTVPKPDFFFLWLYAALALLPPYMETVVILVVPAIAIGYLFALPLISGEGEKSALRRPVPVLAVILIFLTLGLLNYLGDTSPWSPVMEAWTTDPINEKALAGRTPLELQGAVVVQFAQCRNCHAIDGVGGVRGPDLSGVGSRLNYDQLVRQVVQGGGNMPAYGQNLSHAQVQAVASYLSSLTASSQPAARNSTTPAALLTPEAQGAAAKPEVR